MELYWLGTWRVAAWQIEADNSKNGQEKRKADNNFRARFREGLIILDSNIISDKSQASSMGAIFPPMRDEIGKFKRIDLVITIIDI